MLGQPGAKRLYACGHGLLLHGRTRVRLGRCLLPCILQRVGQRRLEVDEGYRRDCRGILRRRAPVSFRHHPALREHRRRVQRRRTAESASSSPTRRRSAPCTESRYVPRHA